MNPEITRRFAGLRGGIPALSVAAVLAVAAVNCVVSQEHPAAQAAVPTQTQAAARPEQQAAVDGAQLLKLATELKALVDKSSKDTLSLGVIRKADEVERAARGVKEKIRVEAAAN